LEGEEELNAPRRVTPFFENKKKKNSRTNPARFLHLLLLLLLLFAQNPSSNVENLTRDVFGTLSDPSPFEIR
tara:strand:- start:3153 stop:3368 length:216 start_codon:yes stop_codon:yes gene_type:complete